MQSVRPLDGSWSNQRAWTAPALRTAILAAVPVCGRGGTTPFRIRRYRSLLPIAEVFDRRRRECEDRFWVKELSSARAEAREAQSLAELRLHSLTASTLDGLATIVRNINAPNWDGLPKIWVSLLLSAAKITGTNLGIPAFDVKRWVSEFEAIGGRIVPPSRYGAGGTSWPVDSAHTPEIKQTFKRLSDEREANKIRIRLFIERGEVVA
ncbi:hypothetical protein [Methylobacterium sp. WCS2018Hpa-22]|uniref:hypothetical protein n=1 Tax=Methylobacterium sp. WCS2018Hpa-22 TaxID=3073633 RepID=UPI00288B83AE|nr:hypothetical protein [Methylobacterium sp. WCS2018Hpa-22]